MGKVCLESVVALKRRLVWLTPYHVSLFRFRPPPPMNSTHYSSHASPNTTTSHSNPRSVPKSMRTSPCFSDKAYPEYNEGYAAAFLTDRVPPSIA
ncbi:MAG: hypothetical protein NTW85_02570 [Methylococcales bacterium]|nr:hypothetical protein [Methylococcales bacterium]